MYKKVDKFTELPYNNNEVDRMSFKEIWNRAKQKIYDTIDKGNSEIKKYGATIRIFFYRIPIFGVFITLKFFF